MSDKLMKIRTDVYHELDEILNSSTDLYLKAKLTKRLTHGEYVGEPKNGFELVIGDTVKILSLDKVDVFVQQTPTPLSADQQAVLEWLQAYADKDSGGKPFQTLFYLWDCIKANRLGRVEMQALIRLSREEQAQVLQAFASWALEQEAAE